MYGIITRTGDTLSKPRSAARASERCKAFFTCGTDKVYTQFTDLGTATIISSVNLALFSRVVTWSMLFYRCRASIKCIFHFQCIACIWFRRQFWFTSYFILWLENIAMERREKKTELGMETPVMVNSGICSAISMREWCWKLMYEAFSAQKWYNSIWSHLLLWYCGLY